MLHELITPDICELLDEGNLDEVREILDSWLPADLAGIVSSMPADKRPRLIEALNPHVAAQTFAYLDPTLQETLVHQLHEPIVGAIVNEMTPDDRTRLLEHVAPEVRHLLLSLLQPEHFKVAQSLLDYAEGTIGRLMTPQVMAIRKDWTVRHVLDHMRAHGRDSETLNVLYVVDETNRLLDDIRIREFLLAPLEKHVSDLMDDRCIALRAADKKQGAIDVFKKYDRVALPVVDAGDHLLGVVTVDDVLDVAEQRSTAEIQKFGGLEALDEPYVATPLLAMVKKRATWLVILFVGEMLTATAMGYFEGEIAAAPVLALFMPLIISSGGNSGSQAATLIVRALAIGEMTLGGWWMVMRREFLSGSILGLILGTIGILRIALWSAFSDVYGPHWFLVALTVGLSLVGIVLWGSLSGSMLPFVLKRLGIDPATSSAPFVATMVDVTGLIIYFSVAFMVLRGTLL